jgi:hypothetical protein
MFTQPPPAGAYHFRIACWQSVVGRANNAGNPGEVPFSQGGGASALSPSASSWNFPVTVPQGFWCYVTDMVFQSKCIRDAGNALRSSYAVFNSIDTLPEHCPVRHFVTPIILPAGFVIDGTFINQSNEDQNMIAALHGWMVPVS